MYLSSWALGHLSVASPTDGPVCFGRAAHFQNSRHTGRTPPQTGSRFDGIPVPPPLSSQSAQFSDIATFVARCAKNHSIRRTWPTTCRPPTRSDTRPPAPRLQTPTVFSAPIVASLTFPSHQAAKLQEKFSIPKLPWVSPLSLSRLPLLCHRHRHRPPPLPPLGPHLFKFGQAGHPPPSPATSVRSNIKPRSRQPHIQGPSLQRRLSGAFSTRNLEVLPSLVTPQSAHPVPGGDGASGGSPSPHECVLVSAPIKLSHSRVPLPPFPPSPPLTPPIHPSTELHTCCSALRPLALHGLASHMPHTYTQSGPPSSACMSFSS